MPLSIIQPSRATVMIKPVGALCNLDCTYCYYLPTKTIYDGHEHRMTLSTLEEVMAGVLPRFGDDVTIAWQGGEPTLAGLPFFEKAIEYQEKYRRPGQRIHHALQTNGTLLTDDWCRFLKKHDFLIGLSVDGPPHFHDHYRLTNRSKPSSDQVLRGMRLLQKHAVEYNILCVLNDRNVHHPDEIFNYLLNLGSRWIQFIPAIEWVPAPTSGTPAGVTPAAAPGVTASAVPAPPPPPPEANPPRVSQPPLPPANILAPYSPDPTAYGRFLCRVFDLWFERYRQRVSIRIIDAVLNKLVLGVMPFCILDGSCHGQLTIEHDGAVFGCDHFVERRWQLAQIGDLQWKNDIHLDGTSGVGLTIHGRGYQPNALFPGRDIDNENDLESGGYVQNHEPTRPQNVKMISDQSSPNPTVRSRFADPDSSTQTLAAGGGKSAWRLDDLAVPPTLDTDWFDRAEGDRLAAFAARKQNLPPKCIACKWKTFCHGGCPKHRPTGGEVPEPTILCESYIMFYEHAMPRLEWLAGYLRKGHQPPEPDPAVAARKLTHDELNPSKSTSNNTRRATADRLRPNDPCPCGSGKKYKKCHGQPTTAQPAAKRRS